MIRRPPRSTLDRSSAASDVYKRQKQSFALISNVLNKTKNTVEQEVLANRVSKPITKSLYLVNDYLKGCLLYTSPSPRDRTRSRMPSSA